MNPTVISKDMSLLSLKPPLERPYILVLDGIIGAGKTTLIYTVLVPRLRAQGYRVVVVDEPVAEWLASGSLQEFYADPKGRGLQFQLEAFDTRIQAACKLHEEHGSNVDIYILERSIFTDILFMNTLLKDGTIDASAYRVYLRIWSMWRKLMPFTPDLFIYFRPNLSEAMIRVRRRARDGEKVVGEDYQNALLEEHDAFLGGESVKIINPVGVEVEVPVVKITTNKNFMTKDHVGDAIYQTVIGQIEVVIGEPVIA